MLSSLYGDLPPSKDKASGEQGFLADTKKNTTKKPLKANLLGPPAQKPKKAGFSMMMAPPAKKKKTATKSKPLNLNALGKPKPKVPITPRVLTKAGAKPPVPVPAFKKKPSVPGFSKPSVPGFSAPKKPPVPLGGLTPPKPKKVGPAAKKEEKEEAVVDEYNPARPNDYEEYCVEREKRKQREREARKAAERAAEDKLKQPAFKPPAPSGGFNAPNSGFKPPSDKKKLDLNISADEMFARRQRMSVKTKSIGGLAPPAPKNKAGMLPPPPGPPPKRAKGAGAVPVFKTRPGRVIMMKNMVGRGEVDDALEGEIVEECSKYGGVIRCKVFEMGAKVPETEAVRIFVQFSTITAATKALKVMHGRFFGGRIVSAVYYEEKSFNKSELEE